MPGRLKLFKSVTMNQKIENDRLTGLEKSLEEGILARIPRTYPTLHGVLYLGDHAQRCPQTVVATKHRKRVHTHIQC